MELNSNLFNIKPYAWGGQSFGFGESESIILNEISNFIENELPLIKIHEVENQIDIQKNAHQLWVTFRLIEFLPVFNFFESLENKIDENLFYLGEIYFEMKSYYQSAYYFNSYLKKCPNGISLNSPLSFMSIYHKKVRIYDDELFLKQHPDKEWIRLNHGICDVFSNPIYHAFSPNSLEAHTFLAQIYENQDFVKANYHFEKAINFCSNLPLSPYLPYIQFLIKNNQLNEIEKLSDKFWTNIKNIDKNNYFAGSWKSPDDYPKINEYLQKRYPLFFNGINHFYISEQFYNFSIALKGKKNSKKLRLKLLKYSLESYCIFLEKILDFNLDRIYNHDFFWNSKFRMKNLLKEISKFKNKKIKKQFLLHVHSQIIKSLENSIVKLNYLRKCYESDIIKLNQRKTFLDEIEKIFKESLYIKLQILLQFYKDFQQANWILFKLKSLKYNNLNLIRIEKYVKKHLL